MGAHGTKNHFRLRLLLKMVQVFWSKSPERFPFLSSVSGQVALVLGSCFFLLRHSNACITWQES